MSREKQLYLISGNNLEDADARYIVAILEVNIYYLE
jgi:hypothetical protein